MYGPKSKNSKLLTKSLFDYTNYKTYLADGLKSLGRGSQKRMAESIRCQSSYIVQVIKGKAHFSLEQAEDINVFLDHNEREADYFFTLIERARSGTPRLKDRFEKRLKEIRQGTSTHFSDEGKKEGMSECNLQKYYSSWSYTAAHACFSLKEMTTVKVAQYLKLNLQETEQIIDFLTSQKLLVKNEMTYELGPTSCELAKTHPLMASHHQYWRLKALEHRQKVNNHDFYDSVIFCLSQEQFYEFRSRVINFIKRESSKISSVPGQADILTCFNCDLFIV